MYTNTKMKHAIAILLLTIIYTSQLHAQNMWKYDFVVPNDGSFTEAIRRANQRPDKSKRFRIFVRSGNYRVKGGKNTLTTYVNGNEVSFPSPVTTLTAPNTSIIGEGMTNSQVENCPRYDGLTRTSTLFLNGADSTYIQDIELWSNYRDDPKACDENVVALNEKNCTGNILKNVSLIGLKNTYYTSDSGRTYLEDCTIEGTTDIISGGGTVVFNRCKIKISPRGKNMRRRTVSAPSTLKNQSYGYIFNDCTIEGDTTANSSFFLAHPWKNSPRTVFLNTIMEVTPAPAGWDDLYGDYPAQFSEYGSMTPDFQLIDTSVRKKSFKDKTGAYRDADFDVVLTPDEADSYSIDSVFSTWVPENATMQVIPPIPTLTGRTLTWESIPEASCYAIVRDNAVIGFTTSNKYTIPKGTYEGACFAIRCANWYGGLGPKSTEVVYPQR